MAKDRNRFVCQACGAVAPKWQGKCDACGEWNTLQEELAPAALAAGPGPRAGGGASSCRVFHSPQASQRPCHFGWTAPQAWQT